MEVAIIGNQTLGTPTEIHETLYCKNSVILTEDESKAMMIIDRYSDANLFIKPLTRKERRKLIRKKSNK
jgi:hypothetical protein